MIFFYNHRYLRDRQLDTVRRWPQSEVINPEIGRDRKGDAVSKESALSNGVSLSWKSRLPLVNIKLRPSAIPEEAVVYVWGGLMLTGKFIVDLDNPWSLVGYNVNAMRLYRPVIKRMLLSNRCLEIRCMSEACRRSLVMLFGKSLLKKSAVHYPSSGYSLVIRPETIPQQGCRFLFVGTQFDLKGGSQLLKACERIAIACPKCSFHFITHLPPHYEDAVNRIENLKITPATLSRDEITQAMLESDVLLHPSYMESFGMVILEAIRCGLAVITTDMYASSEMVINQKNGFLIKPPISSWKGYMPTNSFLVPNLIKNMKSVNFESFIRELESAMLMVAQNADLLRVMQSNSLEHFQKNFLAKQ
jgi:hypothetical protein